MTAAVQAEDLRQATPALITKSKIKSQQKISANGVEKGTARATQNAPIAKQQLFQRLGDDMAHQLIYFDRPLDSLDLVERLTVAEKSTILEMSSTSTLTAGVHNATISTHMQTIQISKKYALPSPSTSPYSSRSPKWRKGDNIFTLDDFAALAALESLVERFGRVSHMGILDKSYNFFLNRGRDAALYFKVKNKVAVVGGDPLCPPDAFPMILTEFEEYRKKHSLGIAFLGASDQFVRYAKEKNWVTMHFGEERVLNPMTNPVLLEKSGKRIIGQNKQLLDPHKGGITLEVYSPASGKDPQLQQQLVTIYEDWRAERNQKGGLQAFITVYDPFALPDLMTYIYTKGPDGKPNGFAALRKLGANDGFHIDPCIAAPGAPRGISDLLIFSAMALLNRAGISYLSLGYEPMLDLGEIDGMPKMLARVSRAAYRRTFKSLPVGGKKAYHDKFKPDESLQSGLHLVFPSGIPGPRHSAAVMHIANIKVRQLIVTRTSTDQKSPARAGVPPGEKEATDSEKSRTSQSSSTSDADSATT